MSSINANRQWQRANEIANFARELAPSTHEALTRLFAPLAREGESPPSWLLPQDLISRLVGNLGEKLIQQDDAFANAQLDERKRREYRVAAAKVVRERLINARELFRRLYGTGKGITLVGLNAKLWQQNPLQIARVGRQLVDTLRQPGFVFPTVDPSVLVPEPLAYAELIEEPLRRLEMALEENDPAKVQVRDIQGQRDQALATTRDQVRRCLDLMVALYRLAGMDFHAEKLKMATRKRRPPEGEGTDPGKKPAGVPITASQGQTEPLAGAPPDLAGGETSSPPRKIRRRRARPRVHLE